ncbi:MAG: FTR1 family protein [Thermoleophilaceae bacterium]|nr:FTR1 family protein [Thermoleophilaceae bacterium]
MLPTFIIGLREGLEAALIVGILAAFLKREGREDTLKHMWAGVGIAVAICVAVGVSLQVLGSELPQRQQEMLETVVGAAAVAMITFMIVWMCRHSAQLKNQLQGQAANALAEGSAMALIAMAFFAVIREGFETAVFLVAAFDGATNPLTAGLGAVLGLITSFAIGYGIYRGGIKLNLSRFFRLTAAVLVLVAAGLLATTMHTAWESGWITFGQAQALDLTWLVSPGTISSALLTSMLGLQPKPTQIELAAYLLYAIPMLTYVLWPRQSRPQKSAAGRSTPNVQPSPTAS